ncbi:MAG: type II secretion system protein [Lentisphaerae bacterium]|nr:type II secretion system protein [Lentisphaerota bacterium]
MKKAEFTLIEILGVTVLISILAAIGIAGYMYAVESSKESATEAAIERLRAGIESLNDEGLMLKTLSGSKTEFVKITFNPNPDPNDGDRLKFGDNKYKDEDLEKAYKIFAKAIDGAALKKHLNANNIIVDGWGNPILIRFPGKFNRGGFDIISPGSDGKFGEDDGKSAVPTDLKEFQDDNGDWNCDDIANFGGGK